MKSDIIKQFNLPSYIKGKPFSKASELIENKFKDRQDNVSINTKTELLQRLADAQEYIKMQESLKNNSQEVPNLMGEDIPEGMDEFTSTNENFLGGALDKTSSNTGGLISGIANSIPSVLNFGNDIFGKTGIDTSGKTAYDNPNVAGSTAGGLASGALAGTAIMPGIGTAIGAAVGGLSGLIGGGRKKREAEEANRMFSLSQNSQYRGSDFKYGGKMDTNKKQDGGNLSDIFKVTNDIDPNNNFNFLKDPMSVSSLPESPNLKTKAGRTISSAADWLGQNYGSLLRYAPVVSNALTLKNLEKATPQRRERLSSRFQKTPLDEASLFNRINDQNTNRALTEASGGDLGALRANLQGAGLNRTRALSDALLSNRNIERADNSEAQRFNLGVDQFNIGQSNLDLQDRQATDAMYETTRSNFKRALAEDIGSIGKEEVNKKLVRDIFGYTWDGRYFKDSEGNRYTQEEIKNSLKSLTKSPKTNESMFGGYLKYKK